MNSETIVYFVVALILGMLLFHMLKGVCGCKVIEGYTKPLDSKDLAKVWASEQKLLRLLQMGNYTPGQLQNAKNEIKNNTENATSGAGLCDKEDLILKENLVDSCDHIDIFDEMKKIAQEDEIDQETIDGANNNIEELIKIIITKRNDDVMPTDDVYIAEATTDLYEGICKSHYQIDRKCRYGDGECHQSDYCLQPYSLSDFIVLPEEKQSSTRYPISLGVLKNIEKTLMNDNK